MHFVEKITNEVFFSNKNFTNKKGGHGLDYDRFSAR